MRSRLSLLPALTVTALAFGIGALLALYMARARSASSPEEPLPAVAAVPAFSLNGADGRSVTRDDLLGAPWVVDFIFTTCGGVCPMMSARMAQLQGGLPESWPGKLVSITVDPRRDTPEVLRAYAARYGARPERWIFLTGERDAIYRLSLEGFRLGVAENPEADASAGEEPFIHSTRMVLIDGAGQVRGYYDGTEDAAMQDLLRDAAGLAAGDGA